MYLDDKICLNVTSVVDVQCPPLWAHSQHYRIQSSVQIVSIAQIHFKVKVNSNSNRNFIFVIFCGDTKTSSSSYILGCPKVGIWSVCKLASWYVLCIDPPFRIHPIYKCCTISESWDPEHSISEEKMGYTGGKKMTYGSFSITAP